MPAKKGVGPRLRKLRAEEYRSIHLFAVSQGLDLEAIAHNPMALDIEDAKYHDVFDIPISIAKIMGRPQGLYSAGFYIGYIDGPRFIPSLPLAHRLSRLCGTIIRCIKLTWEGERFFLYGKKVLDANIASWSPGLRIVTNPIGEAIGWGIGSRGRSGRMVEPLKDLGWYLRRGG